ncbi:MAG: HlyD family secretion protein [Oscillibacter sp.]|nr:HlyD family secretion protein [Oscillibacter sp.]
MSEKLNLREKLHIGEKRTGGEKPRMSKKLKKGIIIAACAVGVCGAVWGGLTIARNAQRSDVKVYSVNDFCMTDYWGDTSTTSGMVTTDKIQKVFLSSSQTVNKVWVAEGDSVRKGDKLISYDSTLTQASVEQAKIDYDRQDESLTTAKNELEYLKKAKNKETLKQELDKLTAELDALKKKYDEDPAHPYDGDAPVTEGKMDYKKTMTVKGADGSDQTVNVLYYSWLSASRLNDSKVTEILTNLGTLRADKDHPSVDTYVVLVQRYEDKVGGYVDNTVGLVITETYTAGDDTAVPAVPESRSVSFSVRSDLPEFEDTERKYDDAAIKKLQQKINLANMYLENSMEQKDLAKAIVDKAQEVKEKEVNLRLAKLSLDKKIKELGDGNVYAEFDGTVKAVRNADEAYNNSEAVIELSGGGGYYVTGTLSEMELGSVKVGDTVSISSWMTGAACEGTIVSIDDYPTTSGNSWGDGNRNVSYYPFKVFVEEDAGLQANDYVDIQYQKAGTQEQGSSLYLQSWFIRTDNGKSYVMARNEDGRLEQRWVQTGRDLWGSYTQIRGGLTTDDYLAFPYGRDVVEGARTVEAAADELYNDGL